MAQINLYVPDDIADQLRRDAEAAGKSLSKHIVERITKAEPRKKLFSPEFWAEFDRLGPMPDDFVAPSREDTYPERKISFDDIVA